MSAKKENGLRLQDVPLDKLVPNGLRGDLGQTDVEDLIAALQHEGLLQPIVVEEGAEAGTYHVVAGDRRVAAARALKWSTIPAVVRGDATAPGASLMDNIKRRDLNPLQEARAIKALLEAKAYPSAKDLATALGVSTAWVSQSLSILDADPDTQALVEGGRLSKDAAYQTVREARAAAKGKKPETVERQRRAAKAKDPKAVRAATKEAAQERARAGGKRATLKPFPGAEVTITADGKTTVTIRASFDTPEKALTAIKILTTETFARHLARAQKGLDGGEKSKG